MNDPERLGGTSTVGRQNLQHPLSGVSSSFGHLVYPEQGFTARDLLAYYEGVVTHLLPHVTARPLTLVRCPLGADGQCFSQRHARGDEPESIRLARLGDASGAEYLYVDDLEGVFGLVQLDVLEIQTWGCRIDDAERSGLLVFHLDAEPQVGFARIADAALVLRELLGKLELESFVKTTGSRGLHVCVPLVPGLGWDEVMTFGRTVAEALVSAEPNAYTGSDAEAGQGDKVFIDCSSNTRGSSFIAPYSTCAISGAPVATPVSWDELPEIDPRSFNMHTVPARLHALGYDPWRQLHQVRQTLTRLKLRSVASALR